jgi:hypothetical protein
LLQQMTARREALEAELLPEEAHSSASTPGRTTTETAGSGSE